jgi:RNA recognition motif-containing protein
VSQTVFLGNLPTWVTADDISAWLSTDNLVADNIKVIRNPETQESRGFAFIEAPNLDEMQAIIRRFDRAPLEDRLLRANQAQPPRSRGGGGGGDRGPREEREPRREVSDRTEGPPRRRGKRSAKGPGTKSAFAQELAKAL